MISTEAELRLVYRDPHAALVHIAKGILEQSGIECMTRGDHLENTVSWFLPHDTWVELWILDDKRFAEARELLTTESPPPDDASINQCRACGADLDAHFDKCGRCGADISES